MLNKHLLFTAVLLSIGAQTYANIPIESRGLSQNTGGSLSGTSPAAPININWELMQKNQQLENEIRSLRGKLEEQDNEIEKLKNDLQNRYTDLDQRLELLNQKLDPDSSSADPDAQSNTVPPANSPTNTASPTNTTITPSAASNSAPAGNNATPTTNQQDPVELEKAAYTVALDAYKQGGAKKAIAPMQNFIKNHPNSIYTGNAYFWLAEFNLATDPVNYSEAKKNYDIVVKRYPTSSKAPRSLYQLYSIAKDVEHNTTAANQLKAKLLKTYPQAEEVKYFK
ncbi:YbgF trimerization domain-containing protein [Acinetobacter soli]|uniref:YbgF trimerization domain-containing protein n=1 Tax=Acinetobacter soli TaxID=487316 RepID=UPI000468543C|nr:YbgF trimerization domain-containing protein [Acinetobacter soli]MBO3672348.1 tetratricopeptide repeat protein [Acinetobacter soli]MBU3120693.1 tetratricopeptide repeat protein [Acinetobacter soli]MEB4799679.1 YbgF trimerization domain-containing protein [Acinetobacter soli]